MKHDINGLLEAGMQLVGFAGICLVMLAGMNAGKWILGGFFELLDKFDRGGS